MNISFVILSFCFCFCFLNVLNRFFFLSFCSWKTQLVPIDGHGINLILSSFRLSVMHFFCMFLCVFFCSGEMQTSYWLNRFVAPVCKRAHSKWVSNGTPWRRKHENHIYTVLIAFSCCCFGLFCIQKIGCNPFWLSYWFGKEWHKQRKKREKIKKERKKQCKRSSFVVFLRYCLWQSYRILFWNCFSFVN